MNRMKRVFNVITGLLMVLFAAAIFTDAQSSYKVVILVLAVSLLVYGIRLFWFYFRMARHMVGGKSILYRAVIIFDLGLFTVTLSDIPLIYVILYLAGIHLFAGAIDILRANESRKLQAGSWKLQFARGLVNVVMAGLCLAFIHSTTMVISIYAVGLAYSGVTRIIQAFRRTAVVYIQ